MKRFDTKSRPYMSRRILKLRIKRKTRRSPGTPGIRWTRITAVVALAVTFGTGAAASLLLAARGRSAPFDTVRAGAAVRRVAIFVREPSPAAAEHLTLLLRRAETSVPAGAPDAEVLTEIRAAAWMEALRDARRYALEEVERRDQERLHSGDKATPEGRYRVTVVKRTPATKYYKALLLDYPSSEDRQRYSAARSRGEVPSAADIGGLIEIHGDACRGSTGFLISSRWACL